MRPLAIWLGGSVWLATLVLGPTGIAEGADEPPPNIVVVVADDMRLDFVDDMPTVMSELVGKGRTFSRGFVVDPVCCPSRASFLRGQYAHTTSVYDLDGPWGGWSQLVESGIENQMLNTWLDPTYHTALVGKYVNGYNAVAPPGPRGAWDFTRILNKPGYVAGSWTYTDGVTRRTGAEYSTAFLSRMAVEAIDGAGAQPAFLWYAPYAPHAPSTPEPKYVAEAAHCGDVDLTTSPSFNEAGTDTIPVDGLTGMRDKARWLKGKGAFSRDTIEYQGRTRPRQACRTLLSVDDGIAQILAALERKDPGLDDTVIVFTSDQGIQYGEHNWMEKRVPYEGTINVPFVIRADGLLGEQPSTDAQNVVLNIDLAPTLLDMAGVSAVPDCPTQEPFRSPCVARGGGFDGQSLMPLLAGPVTTTPTFVDRVFLIEMYDDAPFPEYCAVRSATASLIRYDKDAGADYEGYDLVSDPNELHSVVYSGSDGVARFRSGGRVVFDALYPELVRLCDPRPPGYLPFPALPA